MAYKSRKIINRAILVALREHKLLRPTWQQVADELGVPIQHVHDQVTRLRKRGLIPPEGQDLAKPAPFKMPARRAEAAASPPLDETALTDESMSPEKRRKALAAIAAFGTEANQIRAIEALNKMDAATDRGIGPVAPMTHEDRVKRLAELMKAVGPEVAFEALEAAFGSESGGTPPGGSDLGGLGGEPDGRPARGSASDDEPGAHDGLVAAEGQETGGPGEGRESDTGREHGTDAPGDPPQEREEVTSTAPEGGR